MVDFAIEFEDELATKFRRILTTGATGQEILSATRKLKDKIKLCRSGPKGGDIEIATEILFRRVHVVVFFVDPLRPHPHIDDVRTVFSACMRRSEVLLLTNEVQAREWIRGN
jgi:methylglyoxal synthase